MLTLVFSRFILTSHRLEPVIHKQKFAPTSAWAFGPVRFGGFRLGKSGYGMAWSGKVSAALACSSLDWSGAVRSGEVRGQKESGTVRSVSAWIGRAGQCRVWIGKVRAARPARCGLAG